MGIMIIYIMSRDEFIHDYNDNSQRYIVFINTHLRYTTILNVSRYNVDVINKLHIKNYHRIDWYEFAWNIC